MFLRFLKLPPLLGPTPIYANVNIHVWRICLLSLVKFDFKLIHKKKTRIKKRPLLKSFHVWETFRKLEYIYVMKLLHAKYVRLVNRVMRRLYTQRTLKKTPLYCCLKKDGACKVLLEKKSNYEQTDRRMVIINIRS